MTATIERPQADTDVDHLKRTNRGLTIAVVVLAVLALGLGAWGIWQATSGSTAPTAPDAVSAVPDAWFAALEQGDDSVLDLYVTGGFHQYGTVRYFGDDITTHLSSGTFTHEWITEPYVITNEGDDTYLVVRGMRNTVPAVGVSVASVLIFEIETGESGGPQIASSQWAKRTNWSATQ